MKFSASLALSTALLLLPHSTLCAESSSTFTATVWSWPVASSSPQQLARVTYDTYDHSTSVKSYTPPQISFEPESIVRVGLYDTKTTKWKGIITSAASFNTTLQQHLTLHVEDSGELYHVGFGAQDRPIASKKNAKAKVEEHPQLLVRLVKPTPGATPHLNKPVVLSPDGKYQEKEPEKTFLQKYWWAILAALVFQLVLSGGGGEK